MPSDAPAAGITLDEVNDMLKHWEVGLVREIAPLAGGSRASPKLRVLAERGAFVLKRRPAVRADIERVRFAHEVMRTVGAAGLPVAQPLAGRDGDTFQVRPAGLYELLPFLEGERWRRAPRQAQEAGRVLADLHRAALETRWHGHVKASSFHGNLMVVEALRRAAAAVAAARPGVDADALTRLCGGLSALYQESSERVDEHEYPALDSQVVHGDWHPGNVLFDGDRVCGVLDFDSARLEPAIADVANGLLQFAVRSGPLRAIAQWPVELDEALFAAFARGFAGPDPGAMQRFVEMVPWLMIEACIAEASIPIAQTGFFAAVPGDQMLAMIARRTEWIRFHSPLLSQRLAREIVG